MCAVPGSKVSGKVERTERKRERERKKERMRRREKEKERMRRRERKENVVKQLAISSVRYVYIYAYLSKHSKKGCSNKFQGRLAFCFPSSPCAFAREYFTGTKLCLLIKTHSGQFQRLRIILRI